MEKITITIEATPSGVDTIVMLDGKEIARQREVPCDGGCECERPDWSEQIDCGDNADLYALVDVLDDKFAFMGLDMLQVFDA